MNKDVVITEQMAMSACRYVFPDAGWRTTTVDGVRVIYAPAAAVARSALIEMRKIEAEERENQDGDRNH